MRNVLAIAQKELKSYFSSPIAYIVIGLFALFYGYFYAVYLQVFLRDSMSMGQMGAGQQAMNVNQQLLRPVLQNRPREISRRAGAVCRYAVGHARAQRRAVPVRPP